jgi:hypothetical protein
VEVFDNAECRGEPRAVKEERNPSARHVLVDASVASPAVRLTVTDIFDQTVAPVVVKAEASRLTEAEPGSASLVTGLAYTFSEKGGKLVRQGISRGFDLSVREQRSSGYAVTFSGLLNAPADGLYVLRAQIDGAFRIKVDGADALHWEGQHGTTEKAAILRLGKGSHPLVVTHDYDDLPARNFSIEWEGPGIARQPVPLAALTSPDDGTSVRAELKCAADGDGTGRVDVVMDARGRAVNRSVLFLGDLQLAESKGPELKYHGPLPQGANTLWARVTYDGNRTADSDHVTLNVTGKPVDAAWTVRNVGDAKSRSGLYQTGAQAFRFFGNGMHTVTRRMAGDFTATVRIDGYNGSHGEPVNRRAWAGLTAREHGEKIDWNWGADFHLVQTAAEGLRTSADFTDFGAGRISSYELPAGRPWLRIMRAGNIWTAWTSADGRAWELGGYQFKKTNAEMDTGLFFSALPQEARAHYHATVSEFSVTPGVAADCIVPAPPVAQDTGGDRLTGVVMARSDANVVVVRSTSGLLRTVDGGRTWASADGALTGQGVRSVAIHPADPLTMLRAGASGLWKTTDGGNTWTKLACDGDFDAAGPSALCGEVLAFDLRDPKILYAGIESRGLYKSTDCGATWQHMGLAGERITAVRMWEWERYYPAPARGMSHLCVTTCPDRWMSLLGRGEPAVKTNATMSRGYLSPDGGASLAVSDERSDTGFYNVVFDKAAQTVNEMRYATAHGIQAQVFAGVHMALYPAQKNLESLRPFTAIAATAMGDQKFGRVITQALQPVKPGRLSRSERWAFEWDWLPIKGVVPAGGLIAVSGDVNPGQQWWFLFTDGLYSSCDGGATLAAVLDAKGAAR